jgi:hypothetical protein
MISFSVGLMEELPPKAGQISSYTVAVRCCIEYQNIGGELLETQS